jgi:hypothetical protein
MDNFLGGGALLDRGPDRIERVSCAAHANHAVAAGFERKWLSAKSVFEKLTGDSVMENQ